MRKFFKFLQDYANGDDANFEFSFTWWEAGAILLIVGLSIYLICR